MLPTFLVIHLFAVIKIFGQTTLAMTFVLVVIVKIFLFFEEQSFLRFVLYDLG